MQTLHDFVTATSKSHTDQAKDEGIVQASAAAKCGRDVASASDASAECVPVLGEAFDTVSVKWVRHSAKIKSLKERLLEEGWLTVKQVSTRLGISRDAINKRRVQGKLKARICKTTANGYTGCRNLRQFQTRK